MEIPTSAPNPYLKPSANLVDAFQYTPAESDLFSELNRWLDLPVGHLSRPLKPGEHLEMAERGSDITDFFNLVQLSVSGADISCSALANTVRGFQPDVTVRDAVASYIFSNTLAVLEVEAGSVRVNRIDIPHGGKAVALPKTVDLKGQIETIMKETQKGRGPAEIAERHDWDAALVEQIVRLYVTHPGVTAEGIMRKMGL